LGGKLLFDQRLGFSGTPSDLLPVELGKCHYEKGSDAKMLRYLTDPLVTSHEMLPDNWTVEVRWCWCWWYLLVVLVGGTCWWYLLVVLVGSTTVGGGTVGGGTGGGGTTVGVVVIFVTFSTDNENLLDHFGTGSNARIHVYLFLMFPSNQYYDQNVANDER